MLKIEQRTTWLVEHSGASLSEETGTHKTQNKHTITINAENWM